MFFKQKKRGLKCILLGMQNELVADGLAVDIGEDSIDVENENGLPILPMGEQLKLQVYGIEGGSRIWMGRVYYSTAEKLQLDNIVICSAAEKRKAYRVNVSSPAHLLGYLPGEGGELIFDEPILLRDVSSGGCLAEVRKGLPIGGKRLKVRITMYGAVELLEVEIRNARDKDSSTALYGLQFTKLNPRIEQEIDLYLLRVQQEQIRRNRNRLGNLHRRR